MLHTVLVTLTVCVDVAPAVCVTVTTLPTAVASLVVEIVETVVVWMPPAAVTVATWVTPFVTVVCGMGGYVKSGPAPPMTRF